MQATLPPPPAPPEPPEPPEPPLPPDPPPSGSPLVPQVQAPSASADGKKLYFFIHNHPQNSYGKEGSDDIWVSSMGENGLWSAPDHLSSPFNIHRSNQVFTALPD
jgi:hypothetical protein